MQAHRRETRLNLFVSSILFYSVLFCLILFYSVLFCSILSILFYHILFNHILGCDLPLQKRPPTRILRLSLSFAVLVHTAPCCPTMSSLQRRFSLPTDPTPFYLPLSASNGPCFVIRSGDVSSPFVTFQFLPVKSPFPTVVTAAVA